MPSDHLESVFDAAEGKWQCYGVYFIMFIVNIISCCIDQDLSGILSSVSFCFSYMSCLMVDCIIYLAYNLLDYFIINQICLPHCRMSKWSSICDNRGSYSVIRYFFHLYYILFNFESCVA